MRNPPFWKNHSDLESAPRDGEIVTVREIYEDPHNHTIGLRFVEHHNPFCPFYDPPLEYGFRYEEFRPLQERKTDISVFTKMLTPTKVLA